MQTRYMQTKNKCLCWLAIACLQIMCSSLSIAAVPPTPNVYLFKTDPSSQNNSTTQTCAQACYYQNVAYSEGSVIEMSGGIKRVCARVANNPTVRHTNNSKIIASAGQMMRDNSDVAKYLYVWQPINQFDQLDQIDQIEDDN